ncbi:GFA family protein [Reinekea blandensis]|uniref:CENP-V/GFA domain-containing protein n=1 Tax=Reinekea blandensis MED297 TaxID=314283 RepID=A4BFZ3_9GAMM|nr:GFA family protein [Reinekea blandensis]EAR09011.1 hypothetical protein MED297_03942 [Reinekea sp. MED297] [Reinekea blandensis MED297]
MMTGSCCCGAVTFELSEKPTLVGMCHCSRCRKLGASALAFVKAESFRLTAGQDLIHHYKPAPPYELDRYFCSACGTALGEVLSDQPSFPINAHCLDVDLGVPLTFHEFVADKPDWYTIGGDAKQFLQNPHD